MIPALEFPYPDKETPGLVSAVQKKLFGFGGGGFFRLWSVLL